MAEKLISSVLFDGFSNVGFAALTTVIGNFNRQFDSDYYGLEVISLDGLPVVGVNNRSEQVDTTPEAAFHRPDYIAVFGGWRDSNLEVPREYLNWLNRCYRFGAVILAVSVSDTGLAASGLLDGRKVSVHWRALAYFQERYPSIIASGNLVEIDGRILSCAAGHSTYDLAFEIIRRDHSVQVAKAVLTENNYVAPDFRNLTQTGHAIGVKGNRHNKLTQAMSIANKFSFSNISVYDWAAALHMSERQLHRMFQSELGLTPQQFFVSNKMLNVQIVLRRSDKSITEIAEEFGFSSVSYFSQAYSRHFGLKPSLDRRS